MNAGGAASATLRNQRRAESVMDRLGCDALLALQPHDVLYLSNHQPQTLDVRWDVSHAALLPRDPRKPSGLVVQALELLFLAGQTLSVDRIETYLAPASDGGRPDGGEPEALSFPGFPLRQGVELPPAIRDKIDISQSTGARAAPTVMHALARLVRAAGLERGRIVTDDARAAEWLAVAGLDQVVCSYDPAAFKDIRIVKTAPEIERLRASAQLNEAACRAAAATARIGMTSAELEFAFLAACAQRGGRGAYLISDLGALPHRHMVAGEPMMLDALASREGYYGDFGRTLVIGEPSAELLRRAAGLDAAWAAARASLRPGADYDTVRQAAVRGAREAGFPEFPPPVAHCLGLQHTDDPGPAGRHSGVNPNRVLEPGMVLNLDMPFIEWGWGALHREDTVLVTESGCELLTSGDATLIVV